MIRSIACFACVCASLLIAPHASAASFDCAHATAPREQLICQDPALSRLDDQLNRLYQAKEAALSLRGAELLQDSQRSWLRFVATVCSSSVPTYGDSRRAPRQCLSQQYRDRLKQVTQVARKIGPFVFNRIDLFAAEPDPNPGTGGLVGFYTKHLAYPQIDAPRLQQTEAWNKWNMKRLSEQTACDGGDYETDYEIGYVSLDVISIGWEDSYYCHGAAHGNWHVHAENLVLRPVLRTLTTDDVFGPGESWIAPLQTLFWTALQTTDWPQRDPDPEDAKSRVDKIVVQPDRWTLTREGLKVGFDSYEVACYACSPPDVTVPWSELKSLLSPHTIAP